MELSIEDRLFFTAARLNPTDAEIRSIDELILSVNDWEYFTNTVISNGLGPLVHRNFSYAVNYDLIPADTISKLKQTYYIACDRNKILYDHFNNALNAFTDHGISVIALKGIFLVNLSENIIIRATQKNKISNPVTNTLVG